MKRFFYCLLCLALLVVCLPQPRASAVGTSASAAVLMDGENGRILYAQREDEPRPIASITKMMTALVAVETQPDLSVSVPIKREYTLAEGSSIYLREGESVTLETLLYGLMLQSGNDAALAVAGYCAGDTETFVDWMNERAESLGMVNSHFCNPNGLHEEQHYSTAHDMALLAQACLQNDVLRTIVSTKSIVLEGRSFANHNKLLWRYDGCVGVKTGFTEAAGRTLVSAAERDGMLLIAVTLNDGNDWADHAALLDYGFANWSRKQLSTAGDSFGRLPVTGSLARFVRVEYATDLSCVVRPDEEITCEFLLPDIVDAPVARGSIAGSITFLRDGQAVGSTYLLYGEDVPSILWEGGLLDRALQFLKGGVRQTMEPFDV